MEQREKIFIGVDPGKTGGISIVNEKRAEAYKMPPNEMDLFDLLSKLVEGKDTFAILEKVHSSPQMGVKSAFTFGQNKGMLLMVLTALKIPFEEVTPHTWQRNLKCLTGGDKNVSKRKAQQLFPDIKITHAIADALLIGEYARRNY